MTSRNSHGQPLQPGVNIDPVDIAAGLAKLHELGYVGTLCDMEADYALRRWARGEEHFADHSMVQSLSGISYTDWRVILSAAVTAGKAKLARESAALDAYRAAKGSD